VTRRTFFIMLLVLALALLGCNLTAPLSLVTQPTPTAAARPAATPTQVPPLDVSGLGEGDLFAEETLLMSLYEQVSPSVVHVLVAQGEGSGFVWNEEGHIITNNHVVQGARTVLVEFFDGNMLEAEVIGLDPQSDIAVIRVDPAEAQLRPVALGDSDVVRVGQFAIAIGNPFGQSWTMTRGIVSALDRTIDSSGSIFSIPEVIQTDAAINPGNSGGPLLDNGGQVIGMNTMILSRSGVSSGVGFAVPINIIKMVVPELITNGRYVYPWLGITAGRVLPADVERLDLPVRQGALIDRVVLDSPADEAGLRAGDVIVAADGDPIPSMDDLIAYLVRNTRPGQEVMLQVIRNGREISVPVILGERPD
jgi:S1-C subfamily serine protease